MFELKHIGVLHPNISIRPIDLLFYDGFQLLEDRKPTNEESELLFSSGIIKPIKETIKLDSPEFKSKHPVLLEKLESEQERYKETCDINGLDCIDEDSIIGSPNDSTIIVENKGITTINPHLLLEQRIRSSGWWQLNVCRAEAYAAYLSLKDGTHAVPIIPDTDNPYSKFVSGYAMKFTSIAVPNLPVRELIKFKYDNQDKLRRLRLAISNLYNAHNDFEFVMEELSLALNKYNKSVELINKKYEIETMELKVGVVNQLKNLLATIDLSIFRGVFSIEKSNIQKQLDLESVMGQEAAYLYEVGKLIDKNSQFTI